MHEQQLRAIHAQACAAVALVDRTITPIDERFWPLYLSAALAAVEPETSQAAAASSDDEAPKRAVLFRVEIQADSCNALSNTLFNLSNRIAADDLSTHSISGSYDSGYEHRLTINDGPTHDEYVRLIDEYLAKKGFRRSKGNPSPIDGHQQEERK